jgi:lactaldehyde dehydrogenase/glycolaldehyde dehydrogenase
MVTGIRSIEQAIDIQTDALTLFIGGRWERGAGAPVNVVSPVTEQPIASVASASAAQVASALSAARLSQRAWGSRPAIERSAVIREISQVLRNNKERLASLLVHEVGKPFKAALSEIDWGVRYADYMAEWDRRIEGEILPSDNPNESIHLVRMPVGVVSAITAWNFPAYNPAISWRHHASLVAASCASEDSSTTSSTSRQKA